MSAMKVGTEEKKKLIAAGVLGALMLGYVGYTFLGSSGSSDAPAPAPAVVIPGGSPTATSNAASPAATRIANNRLDPTLHPEAMLLTESLVYSGVGRNIFLPGAPPIEKAATGIPKPIATARYVPPTPVNRGPPAPPPINLRFFGTATRRDGSRRAFLLHGEDVFVASTGDVVSRRYRIGAITLTTIEVTDLTNNSTQRLPMVSQ